MQLKCTVEESRAFINKEPSISRYNIIFFEQWKIKTWLMLFCYKYLDS